MGGRGERDMGEITCLISILLLSDSTPSGLSVLQSTQPTIHTYQLPVAVLFHHGSVWTDVSSVPAVICSCSGDVQKGKVTLSMERRGEKWKGGREE